MIRPGATIEESFWPVLSWRPTDHAGRPTDQQTEPPRDRSTGPPLGSALHLPPQKPLLPKASGYNGRLCPARTLRFSAYLDCIYRK